MKHLLSLILVLTTAVACHNFSASDASTEQNKQDQEYRTELQKTIAAVQGTYEGFIETGSGQIPLQVVMFPVEVSSGKNAKGELRMFPALRLRYRQLDAVKEDQILEARYVDASGELIASNVSTANPASLDNQVTIRGVLRGDRLTGEVVKGSGRLGSIDLRLTSREINSANSGDDNELYQRYRKQFEAVAGFYEGTVFVTRPGESATSFRITLNMACVDLNINGRLYPRLLGSLRRVGVDPAIYERFLDVDYRADLKPPRISFLARGNDKQGEISNAYFLSMITELHKVQNDGNLSIELTGLMSDKSGELGRVQLIRK